MAKRLTLFILVGMVLGIIAGAIGHAQIGADKDAAATIAGYFKILPDVFLHLIKMIIAPLVLATIVAGIANMGDSAALGRIGLKSLLWFIGASFMSITLGLLLVNLLQPGVGLDLTPTAEIGEVKTSALNLRDFILHIFPESIFGAMAANNILQILVFSIFAGVGLSALGERGMPLVRAVDVLAELMLQVTN
ncbi:MAG: dicarboxylate/amino acid:cation symporter, partial [Sphingopyxis sp.]